MAALAAATLAFSCVEEADPQTGNEADGSAVHDGPMTTIVFNVGDLETRTSYDKTNGHQWSDGDQIRIIWGEAAEESVAATVVGGKVSATVGDVDTYYAVYPEDVEYTLADGQLSVTIPLAQEGTFKSANIMAAKTGADEKVFTFRNLTHIFKFTLSEESKHKGFSFMSNSSDVMLSGTIPVTFNDGNADNPITIGTPLSGSTEVRTGNLEAGKTYYLGLCPDADMSLGFGFKATKSTELSGWSEGALTETSISTKRTDITSIPEIDKAIRNDWFFKPGGTGNGSSWENAGGETLLVELLGSKMNSGNDYNKTTNGWRLYGAELHLAAGTYTLPETIAFSIIVNNKTQIFGGYPDNLEGTSLEGRDVAANKTIISKAGGDRMFYGNNSTLYNWTWDGVTFTSTADLTARGGVLYANGGTSGTIKYVDCTFEALVTTNNAGGGAFDFNAGTNTLNVTFENCTFKGCKAPIGGAIVVESGSRTTLDFDNCTFSENVAGDITTTSDTEVGGAIHMANGTAHINQCIFDGNAADIGAHISMKTAETKVYIYRSVFKNGTAYFKGTGSSRGTAIHSSTLGTSLCINNCIFNENISTNFTTNDGLPCIYANGTNTLTLSSSFNHKGLRAITTNNGGTSALILNNVSKSTKTNDIANNGTRKYNVTNGATGENTNIKSNDNLTINWTEETNLFTWELANVSISNYATVSAIEELVKGSFADFDTWLKTVDTDPYGIDYYGNKRNAEKLNPGAWDEGL